MLMDHIVPAKMEIELDSAKEMPLVSPEHELQSNIRTDSLQIATANVVPTTYDIMFSESAQHILF